MNTMTHAKPPHGPDIAPGSPSSAGPSRDMVDRFAVLAAVGDDPTIAADDAGALVRAPADGPRYDLEPVFATGGLGQIRRAYDRRLGRHVAIKELHAPHPGSVGAARFRREALLTARLEHPAIVPVHDIGEHPNGAPYYCMKLVDGRSLDVLVRACAGLGERLALVPHVLAIADAVAYAHSRGVIHRDLKPANVLVGSFGETVVIDWGLAKELGEHDPPSDPHPVTEGDLADDLTRTGEFVGTIPFMPLEQAEGARIDARADVYAIGAILYFVLSGHLPYEHNGPLSTLQALLAGPPPDLATRTTNLSPDLLAIVRKAMARDPDDRYATASQLAADLRRLLAGRTITARTYTTIDLLRHFANRHRAILGVASVGLALLAATGTYSYAQVVAKHREAESQRLTAVTARESEAAARELADTRAGEARTRAAELLVESGREALFTRHQPRQALTHLAEAYHLTPGDLGLRIMLAEATRAVDRRTHTLTGHTGGVYGLELGSDDRLLARSGAGDITLWDLHNNSALARITHATDDPIVAASRTTNNDEILTYTESNRLGLYSITASRWLSTTQLTGDGLTPPVLALDGPDTALVLDGSLHRVDFRNATVRPHSLANTPRLHRLLAHQIGQNVVIEDAWPGEPFRVIHQDEAHPPHTGEPHPRNDRHSTVASPDGRHIAYVTDGEAPVLLDVATDTAVALDSCGPFHRSESTFDFTTTAAFDSFGEHLYRLVDDHHVARWNTANRTCERVSDDLGDGHDELRVTPDGRTVVAVGRNAEVSLLDGETLALRTRFPAHDRPIRAITISQDSRTLVTGGDDGEARVWDLSDPRLLHRTHALAAASTRAGEMMILRPDTAELVRLEQDGAMPVEHRLATAVTSQQFATTRPLLVGAARNEHRSVVELWPDDRRGSKIDVRDAGYASATPVAASSRHLWIYAAKPGENDHSLLRYDPVSLAPGHTVELTAPLGPVAADTNRAVTFNHHNASLLDLTTNKILAEVPGVFANFSPDGARLFVAAKDGSLRALDSHTGALLKILREPEPVPLFQWADFDDAVVFTPDHTRFVSARVDGAIDEWRADTLEHVFTYTGHTNPPRRFGFTRAGHRMLSLASTPGGADTTAMLWQRGEPTGDRLARHDISMAEFSPHGDTLATGSVDGTVHLWDPNTARLVGALHGHTRPVHALEFSNRGDRLISAAPGDTAIVWQLPLETRTPAEIDALLLRP